MSFGRDIGVDAQRHRRFFPEFGGARRQQPQLAFTFYVEQQDASGQGSVHFFSSLAYAGKYREASGFTGDFHHSCQLAAGDNVESGA